ncbi:MAG: DNA polymerase I [Lachnospiraceae bacterium]|nr:DNA polymerase I [Lachnospiraceae bacterium]
MRLLVLDGNSIANRAFYGIKLLSTRDGRYTNAVFGFLNILQSLLKETEPDAVAVAFDRKEPTFRHQMFDGYKATRHAMPEELAQQMPVLKELLRDLGYTLVEQAGWEADDILGTLAKACEARGDLCFLATGDPDSLQLVSPSTTVLLASTVMGRSETKVMDEAAVKEKYGVTPPQLIEVKSLMGDSSDNIPGVKGIGEKTALGLVQRFGSLEGVYANLDDPFIKPKQRENLTECKETAELSRVLGTIRTDAPVPTEAEAYQVGDGDPAAALELLKQLEMLKMIEKLGLREKAARAEKNAASVLPGERGEDSTSVPSVITPSPLPASPSGTWILAESGKAGGNKKDSAYQADPARWFAVQGNTVCTLTEDSLAALLDAPDVRLEVFDSAPLYAFAYAHGGEGSAVCWDGKLAAYLLDAAANRYELPALITAYDAQEAFRCDVFPEAGAAADLFVKMKAALTEQEQDELYNTIEFPLARVLADMSHIGVLVDKAGIEAFGEKISRLADEAQARIFEKAGEVFNPNSPKQLGEILFEKMGLPHGKKTKTGWSTDADTLEYLKAEAPIIQDILDYRTYQKLKSTYVEGLLKAIGPDGRIHTHFRQTEARTGRLSSDEPNLQNIPIRTELGSQMRAFFIAAPGCTLVDADYSQIELRILAHVTGDKNMQAAFNEGADIHRATAAKIYKIPEILVTPAQRTGAKAVNFGIMYGKGAFSLSNDLGVSIPQAKEFLDSYLAAFPKVDQYMKNVIGEAREKGYTTTLFGRRRALPELKSSNFQLRSAGERMARNTPIQGTAADVIKLAMVRVWERLRAEKLKSRLILTVHDELIIEAPVEESEYVGRLLQEEMEGCVSYAVPLTTEVGFGETWLTAH